MTKVDEKLKELNNYTRKPTQILLKWYNSGSCSKIALINGHCTLFILLDLYEVQCNLGKMVENTLYDIAPYLGAFGAYLMPQ